jgi:hypothetical protein
MGLHVEACDRCGHTRLLANSCRNRHCPTCQRREQARWVERELADLLEVEYFHLVFTLPDQIARIALQNKRVLYGLLFAVTARTLETIAADPTYLGGEIGYTAVLHTWGQTLQHHPHLHCIVPGGALSPDHTRFIRCRPGFFLPVRVLSRLFRRLFVQALEEAYERGELCLRGAIEQLADPAAFHALLAEVGKLAWVVYAKAPTAGPAAVVKYLGRYTHRIAIANARLVAIEDGRVAFRSKDYAAGGVERVMDLDACEFLRRFLQHVLPRSFQRIRHLGLLANRRRATTLALCRSLLAAEPSPEAASASPPLTPPDRPTSARREGEPCPVCRRGRMHAVAWVRLAPDLLSESVPAPLAPDSS